MDLNKREELFENKQKLNKSLKEAFGRMMGISSVAPISTDSNSAVSNRSKLGKRQNVQYPNKAFTEQEDEIEDIGDEEEISPESDLGGSPEAGDEELEVPVDADADNVDDDAEDMDGASEQKMAADAIAQTYLTQLPSDIPVDADENGIVFTEFHDDMHGPFKVLLFPADMSINDVAEIKEPDEAGSELELGDEEGEEDLEMGGEEIAPEGEEEELSEAEMAKGAQDGVVKPKIEGEEESANLNKSPVLKESVEMAKGAQDGIEKPDQKSNTDESYKTHLTEEEEEEEEEEEITEECSEEEEENATLDEYEPEEKIMRESVRDRRLRKKGLIGNDRNPELEEAEKERERDPISQGRKNWKKMFESRNKK